VLMVIPPLGIVFFKGMGQPESTEGEQPVPDAEPEGAPV
jgi:hypothetical protein